MAEPSVTSGQTFYPDGRPIPASELARAAAKGEARWKPGEMVPFIAPDGSGYRIPAEKAQERVAAGWTPVDPAQFEQIKSSKTPASVSEVLGSAAAGFARMRTFGLSDALINEETRQRLETAAPIAGGVGEVAGIASELRSPGVVTRGATRAGEAVANVLPKGAPVVRAAAESATAGAIEGSAFATGTELARLAQGDEDFNAEAFASALGRGVITGAAFGGGAAAGLGTLAKGGTRVASGLRRQYEDLASSLAAREGTVVGDKLTRAQKLTAKSVGIRPEDIKRAGVDNVRVMTQDMLDRGIIRKGSPLSAAMDDLAAKASKTTERLDEVGAEIGGVYKSADDLARAGTPDGKTLVDITKTSRTVLDDAGRKIVTQDRLASLAGTPGLDAKYRIMKPLAEYIGYVRNRKGPFEEAAAKLDKWMDSVKAVESYEDLHKLDTSIRKETSGLDTNKLYGEVAEEFRATLKKTLREEIKLQDPLLAEKLQRLDELYTAYAQLNPKVVEAAAKAQGVRREVTPFDLATLAYGVAAGSPEAVIFGGAKIGAKLVQESDRVAAAQARFFDGMNEATAKERINLFSGLKEAASRSAKLTPRAIAKLETASDEENRRIEEARSTATNPQKLVRDLQEKLLPVAHADAPRAQKIMRIRLEDLDWLRMRIDPYLLDTRQPWELVAPQGTPYGKGPPVELPPSILASVNRAGKALEDPFGELAPLKDGDPVSPELVDVVRQRRPKLRDALEREFDRNVLDLADEGKVMSYEMRLQASSLTGKAYDISVKPGAVAFNQRIWASAGAPKVETPTPGPGGGSGRRPTRPARERLSRFRTTAQEVMNYEQE